MKDKLGFVEAVGKSFGKERKASSPRLWGVLKDVVIVGNTATGRAALPGYENAPERGPKKVQEKIYKTFTFRRVNGGWLLDSLGWGD